MYPVKTLLPGEYFNMIKYPAKSKNERHFKTTQYERTTILM